MNLKQENKKKIKTPITRSENMSRIRSTNTSIEIMLRKELWKRDLRYRINDKSVFGKPDIVFKGRKIAVFCDSEFWHGKDYLEGKYIVKTNKDYWIPKLERNIARDRAVNEKLKQEGWTVLRFWSKDIKNNLSQIADIIEKEYNKQKLSLI